MPRMTWLAVAEPIGIFRITCTKVPGSATKGASRFTSIRVAWAPIAAPIGNV